MPLKKEEISQEQLDALLKMAVYQAKIISLIPADTTMKAGQAAAAAGAITELPTQEEIETFQEIYKKEVGSK